VTLGGNNTAYTGLTTINNGKLTVSNANGLGATAAGTVVNPGGTLEIANVNVAEPLTLSGRGLPVVLAAILNNYGAWLCRSGHAAEAAEHFRRAMADPFYKTPAAALTNSGTCLLKAGKRDAAEVALRKALELHPDEPEALIQLAAVLYDKGEFFKARAFVQRFEATSQARPEALMLGRNIELRLGNGRGAGDYTRKLLQGFPESEQARSLSAQGQS
jgi:tetratricopeptide (TPR) repeat protein